MDTHTSLTAFYSNQSSFSQIKYALFTIHEAVLLSRSPFFALIVAFLEPAEQNFDSAGGSF